MKKISVFCIFRDSESHLGSLFSQLESLEKLEGYAFSYFFYENDSLDNTPSLLKNWLIGREGNVLCEKLGTEKFGSVAITSRINNLTLARNKCKDLSKDNSTDYSLLIDSDIEFSDFSFLNLIAAMECSKNAVYVSCNVRQNIPDFTFGRSGDSYYDSYCFRDRYGNAGLYWSFCPFKRKEDRFYWSLGIPIRVASAFGGFSLVKSEVFNLVKWSNDLNSEHVNFCFDIGEHGFLYICPTAFVKTEVDLSRYDLAEFQKIAQQQIFEE